MLVQPRERGGLNLQDPASKAAAMFASQWESAARAELKTFSGCWLREMQRTYQGDATVPAYLAFYFRSCRATLQTAPPLLVGRDLSRSIYAASLASDVPVPKAMRQVNVEVQRQIWRTVYTKGPPPAPEAALAGCYSPRLRPRPCAA